MKKSNNYWCKDDELYYGTWLVNFQVRNFPKFELFYMDYLKLTYKYGFLLPGALASIIVEPNFSFREIKKIMIDHLNHSDMLEHEISYNENLYDIDKMLETHNIRGNHISIGYGYWLNQNSYLMPSILFYYNENKCIQKSQVYSIENIYDFDLERLDVWTIEPPLEVDGLNGINIFLKNDLFFSKLHNEKIYKETGKYQYVDNMDLALLNTPRFNSFIRGLKELSQKYGLKVEFESENEEVVEDGILLDGELIFYEDIEELLEDDYKIENLFKDL